jgi:hypothetical protein
MKESICCALSIMLVCSMLVQAQTAKPSNGTPKPRFEDYPVSETWQGPVPTVEFKSPSERLFRTQIKEAAKKPPDFAGRYRFAMWGCGTRCVGGAIIDLQSGEIFPPPLAGTGTGEERWIFCTDSDKEHGVEYRVDSRLLLIRCGHEYGDHQDDLHYFTWQGDKFQELLHAPGEERK